MVLVQKGRKMEINFFFLEEKGTSFLGGKWLWMKILGTKLIFLSHISIMSTIN